MKTTGSLLTILSFLLLSSCNNTNDIVQPLEEQPITVTADVVRHTKAGYESGIMMPDKFVMDIVQNGNTRYDYSLIEMTRDAGANTYSAPEGLDLLWADDTHSADVKAMTIPFGLTEVDAEGIMEVSVSLEQNDASNVAASDLLGATSDSDGGITISGTDINIKFQHLLTKLDVKYRFASEFDENTIAVNSLTLQSICTTGGFSYADMALDATNLGYGNIAMFNDTDASTAEAIFFPYKPTENPRLLINVTIDGVEYNFSCPVAPKDANGFVGGKRYTMTVSLVGSAISGTEPTIANGWDTNTDEKSFVTES